MDTTIDINTGLNITTPHCSTEVTVCQTGPLTDEVAELLYCFAGKRYVVAKALKDNPEFVRKAREAVKEVRRLQREIKALMTPVLRKAEKAVARTKLQG